MKHLFLGLVLLLSISSGSAQTLAKNTKRDHLSIGCSVNSFGRDFGVGVNVTSPTFLGGHAAIRASENYQWLDHLDKTGMHTWTAYHLLKVGAAGINASLSDAIRLYGEGGVAIALLPAALSTETTVIGGYGLFGFEFLLPGNWCYFIELGGMGTGATADKVTSAPIFANGFLASTGLRVNL